MFEKSAFCLIDDAAEGTRTYTEIQKAAEHLPEISSDLAKEFELSTESKSGDDIAEELTAVLAKEDNFDRARETIQETIASATARAKDRKKEMQVSSRISQARQILSDAKESIDEKASRKGVLAALTEITALIADLRQWAEADD